MSELFAQDWQLWISLALGLTIVAISLRIYARLLRRVLSGHGKISVEPLGLPDLLMAIVLMSWLGSTALHGFVRKGATPPVTNQVIVFTGFLSAAVVAVVTLFFVVRRISVVRLLGLRPASAWFIVKSGASLLLAALPLVVLATALVQWRMGEEPEPQEVVKFFSDAAGHGQWGRVVLSAVFGVLIAPATEEFLFRGYFYGVMKRFLGPLAALLIVSALFAAIHVSAASFPPLFLLACCLTLAYEATGSLWTPILMHALFNSIMLATMLLNAFRS